MDDDQLPVAAAGRQISDPRLLLEAKEIAIANAKLAKMLGEDEELAQLNPALKEVLDRGDYVIEEQPERLYKLPTSAAKFLDKGLFEQMNGMLAEVREANNELVGLRLSQAEAVLAGDSRIDDLNGRLMAWADKYVASRVAKTAWRSGGPLRQLSTLLMELFPTFQGIAHCAGAVHELFLDDFCSYLALLVFDKVGGNRLKIKFDRSTLTADFEEPEVEDLEQEILLAVGSNFRFHRREDLRYILEIVAETLGERDYRAPVEEVRRELELLADDIQEMRPFLRHNFKPENVMLEAAPGLVVSWTWNRGQDLGLVAVAVSIEEMIAAHKKQSYGLLLSLRGKGLLVNPLMPWSNAGTIAAKDDSVLRANLKVVRQIHSVLYGFYEKVDIAAVLARYAKRSAAAPVEPSDEEFAASCQVVAESVDELGDGVPGAGIFRAIRVQRLCAILADRLGCEVRQGKGSEIVVYREGGHHFRLGHHKRNNYIPTALVKSMLKRVGVSFDEWLAVTQ